MKLLNRDQILGAKDMVFEDVATPEWAPEGSTDEERAQAGVRIRNLTGNGRGVFIQQSLEMKKTEDAGKRVDFEIEMLLVAMTAVDEEGKLIFTRDDIAALGERNAAPVARCAEVAARLSGISQKARDEAVKKSEPAPT